MKRSNQISLAAVIVMALFVSLNAGTASAKSPGHKGGSHKVSAKKNAGKHRHNRGRFSKNRSHRLDPWLLLHSHLRNRIVRPGRRDRGADRDADATLADADPGIEVEFWRPHPPAPQLPQPPHRRARPARLPRRQGWSPPRLNPQPQNAWARLRSGRLVRNAAGFPSGGIFLRFRKAAKPRKSRVFPAILGSVPTIRS